MSEWKPLGGGGESARTTSTRRIAVTSLTSLLAALSGCPVAFAADGGMGLHSLTSELNFRTFGTNRSR